MIDHKKMYSVKSMIHDYLYRRKAGEIDIWI